MPDACFWNILPEFYAQTLRNSLFTGLLTIGTFLFAVKTFIVIKLKEDIFDTPFYRERVERHRRAKPSGNISQYGPLKRLTSVLYYASVVALFSAVLQLTVGLFEAAWSAVLCIVSALVSISLLFTAMFLVKRNLNIWLKELEKKAENR